MMSAEKARELGLKPLAKYVVGAVAGLEPSIMGLGPIHAIKKALERASLTIEDIGLVELNEAFASQSLVHPPIEIGSGESECQWRGNSFWPSARCKRGAYFNNTSPRNEKAESTLWPCDDVCRRRPRHIRHYRKYR